MSTKEIVAELLGHLPDDISLREVAREIESIAAVQDGFGSDAKKAVNVRAASSRPSGLCAGEFVVPDDFDAPLPADILADFECR